MAEPLTSDLLAQMGARIAAKLAAAKRTAEPRPAYDALHEAAAVLSWFDSSQLSAATGERAQESIDRLLAHSVHTFDSNGERRWTLAPDVRVEVLRQLREGARARSVLEALPQHPDDPLQFALEQCLAGSPAPVESQTLEELGASYQVCEWLRKAGFEGVPDKDAIGRRIEWLTLLQPFEHLAGEHFRGRVRELQALRDYAGVLPPGTVYGTARRIVEKVLSLNDKPPLVIYGPGGVGKSTLLSRFILEHARALEQDRFPFAYLDFDRPDVAGQEPLTLLIEAVRQLGIEYPDARESCERIRRNWLDMLAKNAPTSEATPVPLTDNARARAAAVRDFATLIDSLGAHDRPVLFVLDTFEEVQWHSEQHVNAIWRLLDELQPAVTRLRVVVAGRSNLAGRKGLELPLTGLDEAAAVGYLQARGIADLEVAQRLAGQIGGTPLSLQLAAELFQREGLNSSGKLDIETRTLFYLRMDEQLIQRQLFKRVLGHIHDPDVRKLAHPGLLLRRITPELVLKVLAEPCGLAISTLEEARKLFDELKREVSLVTVAPDGALEHRQDLRRVMLELLQNSEPKKTFEIHGRAVDFYERRRHATPPERAEEIYHRLSLRQDLEVIDARWMKGVESHLFNALSEFEGTQSAYLASRLGVEVAPETLRSAETRDWERIVSRKVREMLAHGRPEEAVELLRTREDRTSKSPLFELEATALARLGYKSDSLAVLMRGYERASGDGQTRLAVKLTLQAAEFILASGPARLAGVVVRRLVELIESQPRAADRLALVAHLMALARFEPSLVPQDLSRTERLLRELFDSVSDVGLTARPSLARWAALSFGPEDIGRLIRVLRLTGLPRIKGRSTRHLASALTLFDMDVSRSLGRNPGALAHELRLPPAADHLLISVWVKFLFSESSRTVAAALSTALETYAPFVPPMLFDAVRDVMLTGLGIERRSEESEYQPPVQQNARGIATASSLTAELRQATVAALVSAFSADELREFLMYRLDRNLDAIVRPDNLRGMVYTLVQAAEAQGWLNDLVAKARESRPQNADLADVAERLGLSSLSAADVILETGFRSPNTRLNPSLFRERLGAIEAQVCRVDVGGRSFGTGFLVGIDLVLTADFVLHDIHEGRVEPSQVRMRFDYKVDRSGAPLTSGTQFGLQREWLVARSEYGEGPEQLGYAIIRVDSSPGAQPIGGASDESTAALRRWMEVAEHPPQVTPGDGLLMVHYPDGKPLQLATSGEGVVGLSKDYTRVYHRLDALPGSSGAPCFNFDFDVVAFHIGYGVYAERDVPGEVGLAVLMAAVQEDLRRRGLGELLAGRFV